MRLPVTSYQLPVTSYQLPVTSYQLPVTSYQLPVTNVTHYFGIEEKEEVDPRTLPAIRPYSGSDANQASHSRSNTVNPGRSEREGDHGGTQPTEAESQRGNPRRGR
jgi:hypothetical protein